MSTTSHPENAVAPARRGRPRSGQSDLSRETIVQAAVDIIGSEGAGALSLRVVARRLGVDAKSLYNHIENKEALLDAVAEHVLSRMVIPERTGDLRSDLVAIAHAFRAAALSSHREAATLVLSRPVESLAHLAPLEATLAALISAGAKPAWAVHAVRAVLAFMTGTLLREATTGLTLGSDDVEIASPREAALGKLGLPHIALVAHHLSRLDHAREFDFGIKILADAFIHELGNPS
ncbi:TetR family transcriptional regulator [Duganella sp. FT80W]|uniref:TetR family transcriptional regulator n=1 Tax=Duganella guangzhouensis TaxID=2666084 RepID=A0A6I2L3V8_9BURK|nr:TetR/AcrR family transcriptional regulator C-terminal domain-containing protein [Duganella guangzhouensis]MRW92821.1 TetR family transcriptional regulator [Duganella guangzhouensis]